MDSIAHEPPGNQERTEYIMKITGYNLGHKRMEEIEIPVVGIMENRPSGQQWPIFGLKMMEDEKWTRLCEEQQRKHPELYMGVKC